MSDARRQELERLAASGDPEARRALFLELARAGDPEFQAAVALRQRLRKAFYQVVDWGFPPSVAPLSREVAVRFSALVAVLAETLSDYADERAHYVFREIAAGANPYKPLRCGALALRIEDRLWVGLGVTEAQRLLPSGLWEGLVPWRTNSRRLTLLRCLEEWVQREDWRRRIGCRRQRVVQGSATAARLLCRLDASVGSGPQGAWWSVSRDEVRGPRFEAYTRDAEDPVWSRVAELCSAWQPDELEGVLQDHFARGRAAELYPVEAEHLAGLLSGWSGGARVLQGSDRVRIECLCQRLELHDAALKGLLREAANVEHLSQLAPPQVPRLLARLRGLEQKRIRALSTSLRDDAGAEARWRSNWLMDEALERDLDRTHDADARRRIGAEWCRRVKPDARYADLPALLGSPTVKWQVPLPEAPHPGAFLAAGPLGVAWSDESAVHLFCADTGSLRAELPPARTGWQMADVLVLLVGNRHLAGYCLWTGQELYRTRLPLFTLETYQRVGEFLVEPEDGGALRFVDPRRPPVLAWKNTASLGSAWGALSAEIRLAGRRGGRCLRDEAGAVLGDWYGDSRYYTDQDQPAEWGLQDNDVPLALLPGQVLVRRHPDLVLLDRSSGVVTNSFRVRGRHLGRYHWVSRDHLVLANPNLEVHSLEGGREEWLLDDLSYCPVAPGWRCLYAAAYRHRPKGRFLLCLEEST